MFNMGRPKGGNNRKWTQKEKLEIVKRYFEEGIGQRALAKEVGIAAGMLYTWIQKYLDKGEDGLINRKKPGNHYAAIYTSKSLTEEERLRLIIAQQEIEIERLKKGYFVKGVGTNKEFIITKGASLQS